MTKKKQAEDVSGAQAILILLADGEAYSTYQISRALDTNGTGQTLRRLRVLERNGRVETVPGDRPGWRRWRITIEE